MAELREAVETREETVVDDVATRMGYTLKKERKAIIFKVRQDQEVLAVLPGIWEVSLLFYVATYI